MNNNSKTKSLVLCASILIAIFSAGLILTCSHSPGDSRPSGSRLDVSLSLASSPELMEMVNSFVVHVSGEGFETFSRPLEFEDGFVRGTIESVPIGDAIIFTVQALDDTLVVYEGVDTVAVLSNMVNQVKINLFPVVSLVKLSPRYLEVDAYQTNSFELKVYGLHDLSQLSFRLHWDIPDQIVFSTEVAGTLSGRVVAYDTTGGLAAPSNYYACGLQNADSANAIVDASGNATLGTISFTSPRPQEVPTTVTISIDSLRMHDTAGNLIDAGSAYRDRAMVAIDAPATPPPALIILEPNSLAFTATHGGESPDSQLFTIKNGGSDTLDWSVSDNVDWLHVAPASGTGNFDTVTVFINTTDSAAGLYSAEITVTDPKAFNSPQTVGVSYEILQQQPRIVLTPNNLTFSASQDGPSPDSQTFVIANGGGGTLNWSIADTCSWLQVDPPVSGTSNSDTITVRVSTLELPPDTYTCAITVNSSNADNDPQVVPVTFTLLEAPPLLVVDSSTISFAVDSGSTLPLSKSFHISNNGGDTLDWSIWHEAPWLAVNPVNGYSNSADITLGLNTTDLVPGTHSIVLTVEAYNDGMEEIEITCVVSPPPSVIASTPSGADVLIGAMITATFSEAMDPTTINGTNFILFYGSPDTMRVAVTVTYDSVNYKATFSPIDILSYGTDYTATITTGVKDLAGNNMRSEYTWEFSTEPRTLDPIFGFALDEPEGWRADWNTKVLHFQWDRSSDTNVTGYYLYARDNKLNTDYVLIYDHSQQISPIQTATINLPAEFDAFSDDGIQTPFSNGTIIEFNIRAYGNDASGPLTDLISVRDDTPPGSGDALDGGNNSLRIEQYFGSADNTSGQTEATVRIRLRDSLEYMQPSANPDFWFYENGGDRNYTLPNSAGHWVWNSSNRMGEAWITVPIGKCGAGDSLYLEFCDNSGNCTFYGEVAIRLQPHLVITDPRSYGSPDFEAPVSTVDWTITDPLGYFYGALDLFWSNDRGITWHDSILGWTYWDSDPTTLTVMDTVYSNNYVLGLRDHDGGWIWKSDVFTHSGVDVTGPDSAWLDTSQFYDRDGVDSTGVPLTWAYAGLDSVVIQYGFRDEGWSAWIYDTTIAVSGGAGSYSFYPPELGFDYRCNVRVADWDADNRPNDEIAWTFDVTHDYVNITAPVGSEWVAGGSDYELTWDAVYVAGSRIRLEYTIDRGATWRTIASSTANDGNFAWSVPSNAYSNDSARVRILDNFGLNVLDEVGNFTISGIVIDSPTVGVEWLAGAAHDIEWHTVGAPGLIDLWLSHDNFVIDSALIAANTADDGVFTWFVSNTPDSTVYIRARTNTDDTYATTGPFMIGGLVLASPNGGEVWTLNTPHYISWYTVGYSAGYADVKLEYSANGGVDWHGIVGAGSIPPYTNTFSWTLDPMVDMDLQASTSCWVRVSTTWAPFVYDVSNTAFEIK